MAMSATTQQAVRSDINVTPLVDVCLVLLIIFMLVTPLLGPPVQLPQTANPDKVPAEAKQLAVAIQQDGSILVDNQRVAAAQLLTTLRQIHDLAPQRTLVVNGDSRLKYDEVRRLMRTINQAGFDGAVLATQKKGQPAA
jgi:biopolymer transport protein ExbD